jgi:CubicO group peptidase (beta-lactamase class C family)
VFICGYFAGFAAGSNFLLNGSSINATMRWLGTAPAAQLRKKCTRRTFTVFVRLPTLYSPLTARFFTVFHRFSGFLPRQKIKTFAMRTHFTRCFVSIFLALLVAGSWFRASAATPPKFDAEKLAAIAPGMKSFVEDQKISGAVILIGTSQGIVYLEAIGNQTLDTEASAAKPMPKDAIFRIMSMTKPITSMGVLLLRDEGKLTLNDPVEKYLPEFKSEMVLDSKDVDTWTLKKASRPITIADLLTHTAGVPDYPPGIGNLIHKQNHTLGEAVAISSQRPLDFQPGTKWKYSSAGIDTLGHLIEVVSGQPFDEYLQERFFEPLQMHDTGFYLTAKQAERLAELCEIRDGKLIDAANLPNSHAGNPTVKPKFPSPAGGLYSTAQDLAKLCQMFLNGGELNGRRIIAEKTLHEMTEKHTGDLKAGFVPGSAWGWGFALVDHPEGITAMLSPGTFGHGGLYGTQEWIDPVKDVYYVLLIQRAGLGNSDGSPMRDKFQTLAAKAIEK